MKFGRYQSQLAKIAKGNELRPFAVATLEQEIQQLSQTREKANELLQTYQVLGDAICENFLSTHSPEEGFHNVEAEFEAEAQQLAEKEAHIKQKLQELRDKTTSIAQPVAKTNDERLEAFKQLDAKALKKCYKFLNSEHEENLVFIVENFTAVIKGTPTTTPREVQLMFMDFDKLN